MAKERKKEVQLNSNFSTPSLTEQSNPCVHLRHMHIETSMFTARFRSAAIQASSSTDTQEQQLQKWLPFRAILVTFWLVIRHPNRIQVNCAVQYGPYKHSGK